MCAGTFVHIHGMQSCEPSCIVVLTGALQATTTWIETSATRGRCGVASMGWSGGHMNTNKYHPGSVWAGVAATWIRTHASGAVRPPTHHSILS